MLVQQRASGALEISGNPGGSVFLSGGYLTFAESPAVPDLRSRLISSQRLSTEQWNQVAEANHAHGGVGTLLVSREIITINDLRALLWSITVDALVALATPLSAELDAVGFKFWPRRSPWVGSLLRLDVASLLADVELRAERLAVHNIPAEAHPRWCDLSHPWAVVRNEQWAVACQSDGVVTVKDLAWRNGFSLCDAMEWVGELVQSGLCTVGTSAVATPADTAVASKDAGSRERRSVYRPRFGERRARQEAETGSLSRRPQRETEPAYESARPRSEPANGAVPPPDRPDEGVLPLPQRSPGATLATRAKMSDTSQRRPRAATQTSQKAPHPDLLRRILKGLKRAD